MGEPLHDFVITLGKKNCEPGLESGETNASNQTSDGQSAKPMVPNKELTNECSEDLDEIHIPTTMRFAAEYRGRYYRMAGPEELRKFLRNPTQFIPPYAHRALPKETDLPRRIPTDSPLLNRDAFPTQLILRGYCPVCFFEGHQRYDGLKLGLPEFLASYCNDVYTFCSNECLLAFLK